MTETAETLTASPARPADRRGPRHPGLDAIRGLAVVAVIAYHLGFLSGGFLGVDVFFVLSGYLITALALAERDRTGGFGLRAFWGRRVRRLGPAVFVVVPVVLIAAHVVGWDRTVYGALGWDGFATLTWWMNWRQAFGAESGYWGGAPSPFRHAWSLAIEEQFYLLWPLVLTAALTAAQRLRRSMRSTVLVTAGGLGLASAVWAVVLAHRVSVHDLTRIYAGTDTRIVAPLLGCVLAALLHRRRPIDQPIPTDRSFLVERIVGLASAAVIVWLVVTVDITDPDLYRRGILPIVAVLTAIVVSAAATVPRIDPVTSWLGRRSYALYLWSWPIQVLLQEIRPLAGRGKIALATVPMSLIAAELSWWIVEKPAQRRTGWARVPRSRRLVATAMVTVAALTVGFVFRASEPPVLGDAPALESALESAARPPMSAPPGSPGEGGEQVLLLGDSVALTLGYLGPAPGDVAGIESVDLLALIGCGQLSADGYRYPHVDGNGWAEASPVCAARDRIEEFGFERRPSVVVVQSGPWEFSDLLAPDGSIVEGRSPAMADLLIDDLVTQAERADRVGARTRFLSFACPGPLTEPVERLDPDFLRWFDGLLDTAAERARAAGFDAEVLQPTEAVCIDADPTGAPTPEKDAAFDREVHVRDPEGGRWAWETWLGPAIVAGD